MSNDQKTRVWKGILLQSTEPLMVVTLGDFHGQLSIIKYLNLFFLYYVLLLNHLGKMEWPFLRPAALQVIQLCLTWQVCLSGTWFYTSSSTESHSWEPRIKTQLLSRNSSQRLWPSLSKVLKHVLNLILEKGPLISVETLSGSTDLMEQQHWDAPSQGISGWRDRGRSTAVQQAVLVTLLNCPSKI